MPKIINSLLVLLLALTACVPATISISTPTTAPVSPSESDPPQPTPSAIPTEVVSIGQTPMVPEQTTESPTVQPQPISTVFDQAGYRQFAITRTFFPGWINYVNDRNYTIVHRSFSPDGNLLAMSGCWGSMDNFLDCETKESGFLVIVDVNSGELIANVPVNGSWPHLTDFSADSQQLLFSTRQQQVTLWDIEAQEPAAMLNTVRRSNSRAYPSVAALPDGSGYAAFIAGTLLVWNQGGELVQEIPSLQSANNASLAYSQDGSKLLSFSVRGAVVEVYDTVRWKLSNRIEAKEVFSAALSPDGHILAVLVGDGRSVSIWQLGTGGEPIRVELGNRGNSLHFNPAGDLLIISGIGDLDTVDGYSVSAIVVETQTWNKLGQLYSFFGHGPLAFSRDGTRMMVFDSALTSLWGLPDETLLAGLEVVRQFQKALSMGDFATAASLFDPSVYGADYFAGMGIDVDDLAGSFEQLCVSGEIFCQPVRELVMMGYDWYNMVYLVRLESPGGEAFTSPEGAQIIYLTLEADVAGTLRVTFPGMDY